MEVRKGCCLLKFFGQKKFVRARDVFFSRMVREVIKSNVAEFFSKWAELGAILLKLCLCCPKAIDGF